MAIHPATDRVQRTKVPSYGGCRAFAVFFSLTPLYSPRIVRPSISPRLRQGGRNVLGLKSGVVWSPKGNEPPSPFVRDVCHGRHAARVRRRHRLGRGCPISPPCLFATSERRLQRTRVTFTKAVTAQPEQTWYCA